MSRILKLCANLRIVLWLQGMRSIVNIMRSIVNIMMLLAFFIIGSQAQSFAEHSFAIVGDGGRWNSWARTIAESIQKSGVKEMILPGDNLYDTYLEYHDVWDPWIATAGANFTAVAIGNHRRSYEEEMAYFKLPGQYYSKLIDTGVRAIVLNSDNDKTGPTQAAWLDKELSLATEPLIFIIYHHPSYTITQTHHWAERRRFQEAIRPVIWAYRSKITALLLGHDHIASVVHFNDLPAIVSGLGHEARNESPRDEVQGGITVKTTWLSERKPYWVRLNVASKASSAEISFIRAATGEIGCLVNIVTGNKAQVKSGCQ